MRLALILSLAAGCGFHAVGHGDAAVGAPDDMGGENADLAGADLAGGGGCPLPQLLVGVEHVSSSSNVGGRVARLAISPTGTSGCGTLRGQGLIGAQPLAVAAFAGGVAAATRDGLYVIDPLSDAIRWQKPTPPTQNGWLPLEAMALENPSHQPIIAVAYGLSAISEIDAFDRDGAPMPAMPWCIQGSGCTALPLSLSILSMSSNPAAATHLLALDAGNAVAAWDVDPWATPPTKTKYVGAYTESLQSIYAVGYPSTLRLAWSDTSSTGAIQYANDTGSGAPPLAGPVRCNSGCTTVLHVVPDPTNPSGFFALCDGATIETRQVVRVDAALGCTVVVDGVTFGAQSRLSRLAIAQ